MSKVWLLLAVLTGLTACSVLPPAEPVSLYRLPPASPGSNDGERKLPSLRLARPQAVGVLNGNRLLVLTPAQAYQAYGDARWAAPLPQLWQDWLLDALWRYGRFTALSQEEEGIQAEWELAGTLRAFGVELADDRQQAVIRFDARLLHTGDRRMLASRRFEQREVLSQLHADAVVAALGRAADRLAAELHDWLLAQAPPE